MDKTGTGTTTPSQSGRESNGNKRRLILRCSLMSYSGSKWFQVFIGLLSRVYSNGREDQGLIPGRLLPKTQKWYLMPLCLTLSILR